MVDALGLAPVAPHTTIAIAEAKLHTGDDSKDDDDIHLTLDYD